MHVQTCRYTLTTKVGGESKQNKRTVFDDGMWNECWIVFTLSCFFIPLVRAYNNFEKNRKRTLLFYFAMKTCSNFSDISAQIYFYSDNLYCVGLYLHRPNKLDVGTKNLQTNKYTRYCYQKIKLFSTFFYNSMDLNVNFIIRKVFIYYRISLVLSTFIQTNWNSSY